MENKTTPAKYKAMTVLVVDDSVLLLERMIAALEPMEQVERILHAGSFAETMALLQHETPDIALLDINLPDKNGIELLKALKVKFKEMQICMISNQANDFYRTTCKKLGAVHFFDKANDFADIPKVLNELCP